MSRTVPVVPAAALLLLTLMTTAPAWAQGRPCPVEHGTCFMLLPEGDIFFLFDSEDDVDNDGDTDFLVVALDGVNDFLTVLPDGRLRFHVSNQSIPMLYCPFHASLPPDETCVLGTGSATGNGVLGGPLGVCPGKVRMTGTGQRISDGAAFEMSADFQVLPANCDDSLKFRITAEATD